MQGETPEHVRSAMRQAGGREYGQVALRGETVRVATAASGVRNVTLNVVAFRVGRLVAGGALDRADVQSRPASTFVGCGGEVGCGTVGGVSWQARNTCLQPAPMDDLEKYEGWLK
jgi:hypothetical protein